MIQQFESEREYSDVMNGAAAMADITPPTCEKCKQHLHEEEVVWLELSNTNGRYYTGNIPAGHISQGFFPFGKDCAKTANIQH